MSAPSEREIQISSSVRLCWELEEPKGPKDLDASGDQVGRSRPLGQLQLV